MSEDHTTQGTQHDDEYKWHTGKKRPSGVEDAVEQDCPRPSVEPPCHRLFRRA